jgi:hypothetical protein
MGVDAEAEAPLGSPGAEAQLPATPGAPPDEVPLVAVVPRPPPAPALQPDDAPPAAPAGPPPGSIPPSPKQNPRAAAELGAQAAPPSPADVEPSATASSGRAAAAPPQPARKAAASPRARPSTRVRVANARDVDVLRTVWHPHPERRLALVLLPGESAARELREGESAQGWTVLHIDPASVLLLHDGVEVRASVGGGGR